MSSLVEFDLSGDGWTQPELKVLRRVDGVYEKVVRGLQSVKGGSWIASCGDRRFDVWDIGAGGGSEVRKVFSVDESQSVLNVTVSSCGDYIVTGSQNSFAVYKTNMF
ncbi:hypothetical protein BCR33DRAFT_713395, partial [Rhizoclosmatium globosum]